MGSTLRTYRNQIASNFFTRKDLHDRDLVRLLLNLLASNANFEPTAFQVGQRWMPIDGDFDQLTNHWMASGSINLKNRSEFNAELTLTMSWSASGKYNTSLFWVEQEYFTDRARIEQYLDLQIGLYVLLEASYGYIHQTQDAIEMATYRHPIHGRTVRAIDLPNGLPGVFWANFFGPEYVAKVTSARLLSAPCYKAQELFDGGVMILTSQSPIGPNLEPNRLAQERLRNYLGNQIIRP